MARPPKIGAEAALAQLSGWRAAEGVTARDVALARVMDAAAGQLGGR